MLKYINTAITFREIPDEITLCINLSRCEIHCKDCHSKYLWKDVGEELTSEVVDSLIKENTGITCICLMGGKDVSNIISYIKSKYKLQLAWYSGYDISTTLKQLNGIYPNYLKVGSYIKELGGLDNPNTNQRLYKIGTVIDSNNKQELVLTDITYKLNSKEAH